MPDKDESKMKPGPEPDRLNIDGDWEDAMKKAIDKERPEDGWPKHDEENESDGA